MDEIGRVESGEGAELVIDGEIRDFTPKFRESAYTPVKQAVGEAVSREAFEAMKRKVDFAVEKALYKRDRMKAILRGRSRGRGEGR